jgi:FAD-dependent oxidoreductase family protein/S-layer family protein
MSIMQTLFLPSTWAAAGVIMTIAAARVEGEELPSQRFDVVIVSGSASGVGAAIGAARLGVSVALIEDSPVLGGMLSNGIGNADTYSVEATSGLFREFTDKVLEYYRPIMGTDPLFKFHNYRYLPPALEHTRAAYAKGGLTTSGVMDPDEGGRWEPHVADLIFKRMVAQYSNIKVFYRRFATQIIKEGNRVTGVVTYATSQPNAYSPAQPGTGIVFYGDVIIDATHEGDLAAWAGALYRCGREPRSRLEPHAGSIYFYDRTGEILPGSTGQGDNAVVSYGCRLMIQNYSDHDYPAHALPTPPPGYNKADYEHSAFDTAAYNPNGKLEMNMYPFGSEVQEANWSWPEGSREERERLYEVYKNHALGFLYYLQHERHYKVGLPTDDFTDNGYVPYRLYVREARRIMGDYVMSEPDINPYLVGHSLIQPIKEDSIAVGHYPIDSKPFYLKTNVAMPDKGNGNFYINSTMPFQVPCRSIVPQQVEGLLVATAISATHVAFSAIRMDPTWMVMGQAAGIAAALGAQQHLPVRQVPVDMIQRELLKQKCQVMFYWDLPRDHRAFPAIQWLSVRKVVKGYPDRLFRPDQNLSRVEMAALLVKAFDLWPSVSNQHFKDVPYLHWAFRDVESLYDNSVLQVFGMDPVWPKFGSWDEQASRNVGYGQDFGFREFYPDKEVTWKELAGAIHILQMRKQMSPLQEGNPAIIPAAPDPVAWAKRILTGSMFGGDYGAQQFGASDPVTRGAAAALIASLTDQMPGMQSATGN